MRLSRWFAAFIIAALLLSLVGTVAAAAPDNAGKGPPDFAKIVFVHYADDAAPARGGIPGPPAGEGEYKYDGYHWADEDIPVYYLVNLDGAAEPIAFLAGIQAAFQTWEDVPDQYMDFEFAGTTNLYSPDVIDPAEQDYKNVVGWEYLTAEYGEGVIAVNVYWYNILTKELVDSDIAMNTDSYFRWSQNPAGETWTASDDPGAFDVDVQNIVTHESGHSLVLGDLYADYNSEKTMYGYADELELKKRSLDPGDKAGIQEIYPVTEEAPTEGTMHVAAIDMWYDSAGPNYFIYTKVTIRDADGVAVPEATVYLEMTLPDGSKASGSGDTNGEGTVTFKLRSRQTSLYTSNVTNVAKDGWTYDSSSNVETSDSVTVP